MARDGLRLGGDAPDARVRVDTIFASLERLQSGILKAEAVLDRMRAGLEVFRKVARTACRRGDEAMTWGRLASSLSTFGVALAVLVGILSRHFGLVVIAMRNPSLAIGAPGRPTLRCRGRIGPLPRLCEDQRVIVNLPFRGLGLLLMLVLSLIGLSATAGRTLSPEQSVTLARPSTIPMERIHHIQLLP